MALEPWSNRTLVKQNIDRPIAVREVDAETVVNAASYVSCSHR